VMHLVVLRDEYDVRSAGLLDVGAGSGVEIKVLVVAVAVGSDDGVEAHGVVEARLDIDRCRAAQHGRSR
jgi:hypothetical protein